MAASTKSSFVGRSARILCFLVLVSGMAVAATTARAQNNAGGPNDECTCTAGLESPPGFGPKNFWFLIDGRRYDISTYRFFRTAMFGSPEEELPSRAEPFFDSGMYRIIPEVEIVVGPGYGYGASIFESPEPFSDVAAGGFDAETDFIDTEPPTVGEGLRVTTRVFTNECGSKALYFEDGGTSDNFSALAGIVHRLPVLVRLRSLDRDLSFTTFSTTYGFTNDVVENVIGYYPFTGWCVGERGLESLEFELGESVEFDLTVYDYAGNAAAPRSQILEWPIERAVANGTGGNGGTGADGGAGASATDSSSCSARGESDFEGTLGLLALSAGISIIRRRLRRSG